MDNFDYIRFRCKVMGENLDRIVFRTTGLPTKNVSLYEVAYSGMLFREEFAVEEKPVRRRISQHWVPEKMTGSFTCHSMNVESKRCFVVTVDDGELCDIVVAEACECNF